MERRASDRRTRRALASATVLLAGVTAAVALWNPLEVYEREHVCRTTEQSMESLRADIRSDMQARLLAQVRLAQLWTSRTAFTDREREVSSKLFLDHHAGYVGLVWIDPASRVLWSIGRDDHLDVQAVEMGAAQVAIAARQSTLRLGEATLTPRFLLRDGHAAFAVIVLAANGGVAAGFLVAIVDLKAAFDSMVEDHKDLGYSVSVLEGTTEIYGMPGNTHEYEATLGEQGQLEVPGAVWTVRVWPKPAVLSRWRSSLPGVSMVLGGLLGTVLMFAVHFGREAHRNSRDLQQAHDQLEQRVKERTLELEEVNGVLRKEVVDRRRAEDCYRDLSGRLLRLQDEERRRIARELHDSTAQMLGALAINVDRSLALLQVPDLAGLLGVLDESGRFVEEVTQEIRTVSYLLHPPMLDDLGLEYVLPWYAKGFSQRSGIETRLDIQPALGRLPSEVELTLFRIVQESLANVHRHSGSPSVTIRLFRDADAATLEVSDRGSGLPPAVLQPGPAEISSIGVGIAGMRERVRQLRGRMDISSDADGTTLRTVLPLTEPSSSEASV